MPSQIFISYSKKDSFFTHKLADDLSRSGYDIWIDRSIGGGDKWRESIERNLKESKDVIIVVSPNSMLSDWVRHEGSLAYGWGKKIYPVLLETVESLPPWLEEYQWVSFVNVPYEVAFNALTTALTPSSPLQILLDQRTKVYEQTGELFGEELFNVIEDAKDQLVFSEGAAKALKESRLAIERRKQREQEQMTALTNARNKQQDIQKKGRRAVGGILLSFIAFGLVSLLFMVPVSTGWQRFQSLDFLAKGSQDKYVLAVDDKSPESIFVSDGTPGGFYKATFNSKACWTKIEVIPGFDKEVSSIDVSGNTIYIVASEHLFVSVDGGINWQPLQLPEEQGKLIPTVVAMQPDRSHQVFVGTSPAGILNYDSKEKQWQHLDLPESEGTPIEAMDHNGVNLLIATGNTIWARADTSLKWQPVLDGISPIYGISTVGKNGRFFIAGGDQGILDADVSSNKPQPLVDSPPSKSILSVAATNDARYAADENGILYWRLWHWTDLNWLRVQLNQPVPCYE